MKTVVLNSDIMGGESRELGEMLIGSFLRKLCATEKKPDYIVLYHSGVKLIAKESPVIDAFEILSKNGVDVMACGTCVSYYQLNSKIGAGRVGSMQEIVNLLMTSDVVIKI